MQGILWHGLQNSQDEKFLPVLVSVTGANSVSNLKDLEEKFYRSVLAGLIFSNAISTRHDYIKKQLSRFVPWVTSSAMVAASLVFPPAALAADVTKEITKKLLDKFGIKEAEKLVISKEIDPKLAGDFIIKELEGHNIHPIFVIDEFDKVSNDTLLSDFFNGHQGWFQGKRSIISLSYTFGKLVEDAVITSVKRFSAVKNVSGVTTLDQFKSIIHKRIILGISEINNNETEANNMADKIFGAGVYEKILNNHVPNLHLMLESAHRSLNKAITKRVAQVTLEQVVEDGENDIAKPAMLESLILNKLVTGNIGPTDLGSALGRERSTIARSLKIMLDKDWVGKMGSGKNIQYFIKQKGESARHLS